MGVSRNCEVLDLAVLKFVGYEGFMSYNNLLVKYVEMDFPREMFENLNTMFEPDRVIIHWCNMLCVNIHDFLMMLYTENDDLNDVCLNIKLDDFLGVRECVWFVKLRDHVHDDDEEIGCNEMLDCLFPDQMLAVFNKS